MTLINRKNNHEEARRVLYTLIVFAVIVSSCGKNSRYQDALSPEQSIKTFHFAGNFKAEVFAAEPLVVDPVSMQFDEEGNSFVVGMLDAYKPDSVKGRGRIVMLKDQNADGRADTSIVFADSLREATSVLPWEGGLLVAAAPNIMYYKDTDGDGRADVKEVLFTGFFSKNEEAQITNLTYAVDNWIYANNSGYAGEISFSRDPDAPKLQVEGADFRFRLDRNQFELSSGPGQFGLAIDDWGHRLVTQNTIHIRQAVVPRRYLDRNRFLPQDAKNAMEDISDHDLTVYQKSATPYWRQERTNRRNEEFKKRNSDNVEFARDHFTGASGGAFFSGDAFPAEFYGNIFTGDVACNLVHRDILVNDDSAPHFVARRGPEESKQEFMASTDTWFRPTSCVTGPDGYLYIVDMYRQHIETPRAIPADLQTDMDFDAGNQYGRIYRIVPHNAGAYNQEKFNLRRSNSTDLVTLLAHPNQWWRLQAQRLLVQRRDTSVVTLVKKLFTQSQDPRARLHALYVLEALDALDAAIVIEAMKDPSSGVRENAAILAERFPSCLPQLQALATDTSLRVAFQATLSLGEFKGGGVNNTMATVLGRYGSISWFRSAVLSSETSSSIDFIDALERTSFFSKPAPWKQDFFKSFSKVIGVRNDKREVTSLLNLFSQPSISGKPDVQKAGIKGLLEGARNLEQSDSSISKELKKIEEDSANDIDKALNELRILYSKASGK